MRGGLVVSGYRLCSATLGAYSVNVTVMLNASLALFRSAKKNKCVYTVPASHIDLNKPIVYEYSPI